MTRLAKERSRVFTFNSICDVCTHVDSKRVDSLLYLLFQETRYLTKDITKSFERNEKDPPSCAKSLQEEGGPKM